MSVYFRALMAGSNASLLWPIVKWHMHHKLTELKCLHQQDREVWRESGRYIQDETNSTAMADVSALLIIRGSWPVWASSL